MGSTLPERTRRDWIAGGATLLAVLGTAAVAIAYQNDFSSHAEYAEIQRVAGVVCADSYLPAGEAMRIDSGLPSKRYCRYAPAEREGGRVTMRGRIRPSTSETVRKHSFLGVRIGLGRRVFYDLQAKPYNGNIVLIRANGSSESLWRVVRPDLLNGPLQENEVQLRVTEDSARAIVNGEELFTEENNLKVENAKFSFGVGSDNNGKRGTSALVTHVRGGAAER